MANGVESKIFLIYADSAKEEFIFILGCCLLIVSWWFGLPKTHTHTHTHTHTPGW